MTPGELARRVAERLPHHEREIRRHDENQIRTEAERRGDAE